MLKSEGWRSLVVRLVDAKQVCGTWWRPTRAVAVNRGQLAAAAGQRRQLREQRAVAKDARAMAAQKLNGVMNCLKDRTKNSEKEMGGFQIYLYLSVNQRM
jgi:hypothetical protein